MSDSSELTPIPLPEPDKNHDAKLMSVAVTPDPTSTGAVMQFAGLW